MCNIIQYIAQVVAIAGTGYSLVYDMTKIKYSPNDLSWHAYSNLKFLSTLNLLVELLYFGLLPIVDILPLGSFSIVSFVPYFYASVVVPLSLFVAGYRWIMPLINRQYEMPPEYTNDVPKWLFHVKYTLPPVLIFSDMYFNFHPYPSLIVGLSILYAFTFLYILFLHLFHYKTGSWLYPILQNKTLKERWFCLGGICLTLLACYLLGELVNNNLWRQNLVLLSCKHVASNKSCRQTQTTKI